MYIFPEDIRKAYERIPVPLVIDQFVDEKVVPLLFSDGFCKLVNMSREEVIRWFPESQFERVHPDDVGKVAKISDDFARHRGDYNVVFRSRHEDGYHYVHAIAQWMTMEDGSELALLIYTDVSESSETILKNAERYGLLHKDLFYTDPLTDLPNTNYLYEYSKERIHSIRVHGKHPILAYIDVNSMQSYNNQYGYEKGNDLLKLIVAMLQDSFPEALLVRGSEDHFILICDMEDRGEWIRRMEKANRNIRKAAFGNTTGIQVGICDIKEDMDVTESLDHARHALKRLDTDLNTSYRFFSYEADEAYWKQRYIVENFEKAMENRWFKVYYQGIQSTRTGDGVALEALARWVDPVRGIISPADFIPTLSKYHLLYKLDLYMFEQVCREIQQRKDGGLEIMPVSVNFARQDFDHTDIHGELNRIFEQYQIDQFGIGKEYFVIEISEQDMATGTERFYEQLRGLRADGFRLWLDDFGSGYSSLNVFSQFNVDLIKFDMDLMFHLDDNGGVNREILKAMIVVCRKLGIHTLAEGIETEDQMQFLRENGCELAQGYYIHKPDPLESILYKQSYVQKPRKTSSSEFWKQMDLKQSLEENGK